MLFNSKRRITLKTLGDKILASVAEPVLNVDDEIRRIAGEMIEATVVFNGIGLAAPQYGVSKRMVVLDVPLDSMSELPTPGEELLLPRMPLVLINPEIISTSSSKSTRDEGCLSVPDIYAPVERPEKVVLRSMTLDGEMIEVECGGLLGRCIQHELDHLEGKCFTDRLSPEAAREVAGEIKRLIRYGEKKSFMRTKSVK
ncbi:MAG: peptide deformylase [Lentisphaeria bacterium]|nr:peptide deformylase [Lentisphaeria bacterium]